MADNLQDDERYFVIKGRRWRRTDPAIPAALCQQLVNELMAARRAVKAAKTSADETDMLSARVRVQDAKVALGERGHPWWEPATVTDQRIRIAAAIRCLLRAREQGKTICPSEAARAVGGSLWREIMPLTREVAWELEQSGWLWVLQKGERVDSTVKGVIRLRKKPPEL